MKKMEESYWKLVFTVITLSIIFLFIARTACVEGPEHYIVEGLEETCEPSFPWGFLGFGKSEADCAGAGESETGSEEETASAETGGESPSAPTDEPKETPEAEQTKEQIIEAALEAELKERGKAKPDADVTYVPGKLGGEESDEYIGDCEALHSGRVVRSLKWDKLRAKQYKKFIEENANFNNDFSQDYLDSSDFGSCPAYFEKTKELLTALHEEEGKEAPTDEEIFDYQAQLAEGEQSHWVAGRCSAYLGGKWADLCTGNDDGYLCCEEIKALEPGFYHTRPDGKIIDFEGNLFNPVYRQQAKELCNSNGLEQATRQNLVCDLPYGLQCQKGWVKGEGIAGGLGAGQFKYGNQFLQIYALHLTPDGTGGTGTTNCAQVALIVKQNSKDPAYISSLEINEYVMNDGLPMTLSSDGQSIVGFVVKGTGSCWVTKWKVKISGEDMTGALDDDPRWISIKNGERSTFPGNTNATDAIPIMLPMPPCGAYGQWSPKDMDTAGAWCIGKSNTGTYGEDSCRQPTCVRETPACSAVGF